MEKSHLIFSQFLSVLLLFSIIREGSTVDTAGSDYGSANRYVQVRKGAYMFYSFYESPNKPYHTNKTWPIILWLQGGPGSSAFGFGNFFEMGPIDDHLNTRNSTWLRVADLLFVDSPVGTGFSYVHNQSLLVKSEYAAVTDLTTLLISFFDENESLQASPLFIVGESYGGKFAVQLGLRALDAIEGGKLKATLGGVALGNSWISPLDSLSSWAPLLKDMSRLENSDLVQANSTVEGIRNQLKAGNFLDAANSSTYYGDTISKLSNGVSFYNFLKDENAPPIQPNSSKFDGNLTELMNEVVKKKIHVIPETVVWEELSEPVFTALQGDFMKPRTKEVDQLLARGVNVTIYSGQLDLICSTSGTEAWVEKLGWSEIKSFLSAERELFTCGDDQRTRGFRRTYKNLEFFWIFDSGHYVPVDRPYIAQRMIAKITQSPAFDLAWTLCVHDE